MKLILAIVLVYISINAYANDERCFKWKKELDQLSLKIDINQKKLQFVQKRSCDGRVPAENMSCVQNKKAKMHDTLSEIKQMRTEYSQIKSSYSSRCH